MKNFGILARCGTVAAGVALLGGVASAAIGGGYRDQQVDVDVSITGIAEPGVLAMSVDGDSTTLTENGSNATVRQFTGTLPTVTVTDTRSAYEIPDGAGWYVLGTSTDFTGTPASRPSPLATSDGRRN